MSDVAIPDGWQQVRLGDACLLNPSVPIKRGCTYPYVDMASIDVSLRFTSDDWHREFVGGGSRFQAGDTLMARITPCLENGKIAQVSSDSPCGFGSTEFIVFRAVPDCTDANFIYYLVKGPELRNHAVSNMSGTSGRQRVPTEAMRILDILLPPLHEQKAIAHILGSLDDKIDQLRKTNTVLEDMASALFKSWFVDFDPVNAKQENRPTGLPKDLDDLFPDSFEDSALGPIPKGWQVGCVGDVCHIHDSRRKPLSSKERQAMQGGYPYYGAASVLDYVNSYLFDGIFLLLGEDGSVVQKDGTPVLQYVWDKFWVSNHAHVLTGKGISTEQLLIALRSINISPFVTGAVQPKVSQGNMKSIPLVLPDERIANELDRLIIPNYDTYRVNIHQIRTLANLRDTLLPKLISGELRVPDAEQMVAELGL